MQQSVWMLLGAMTISLTSSSQIWQVMAEPHLNLRETPVDGRIVESIGYGESVEPTGRTFGLDTINGLAGTWIEVRWSPEDYPVQTGVVFDAYLWPGEVPLLFDDWARKRGESPETFEAFALRTVDGDAIQLTGSCSEDYGGPSSEQTYLEVACTPGQALAMFRYWLKQLHGTAFSANQLLEAEHQRFTELMESSWEPADAQSLNFGHQSEGGGSSWTVELAGTDRDPIFRFSFSQGSC